MAARKKPDKGEVIHRDGKPVADRPTAARARIAYEHLDSKDVEHYNPDGATAGAAKEALLEVIVTAESRHSGGRKRGEEQRRMAMNEARPIYEKYVELRTAGVPSRQLISRTAEWAQQDERYNKVDKRAIRRMVDRLKKEDSS